MLASAPDRALGLCSWLVVSLMGMTEVGTALESMHKGVKIVRIADVVRSRNVQGGCIL